MDTPQFIDTPVDTRVLLPALAIKAAMNFCVQVCELERQFCWL